MSRYAVPGTPPEKPAEFRLWVIDQLREIGGAVQALETDSVELKQFNAVPEKLYDGLMVYADGTNWNPGSGEGAYIYYNSAWNYLG